MIKALIPSASGNFCQKFLAVLELPRVFWEWFRYVYLEDGNFTDDFKADVCSIPCFGGTGSSGDTPTQVNASDGAYSDKVLVTWATVAGATSYKVYRSESSQFSSSTFLTETSSSQYEDGSVVQGTTYWYWVVATNSTLGTESDPSIPDSGYASSVLTAVSDLDASRGASGGININGYIVGLRFTPAAGATHYDIYRSPVNNFNSPATVKIGSDVQPFDNSESLNNYPPGVSSGNMFFDSDDHLIYYDFLPGGAISWTEQYYWVVQKQKVGSQTVGISGESNSGSGWAIGNGSGVTPQSTNIHLEVGEEITIPAGVSKIWFTMWGQGGGGGGGNAVYGGGGGGGAATVWGEVLVSQGDKFTMTLTPDQVAAGGASGSSGSNGGTTELKLDTGGGYVTIATAGIAGGGGGAGGSPGTGGSGATGSKTGTVLNGDVKDGEDGITPSGTEGGRSGGRFVQKRFPGAHLNGFAVGSYVGAGNNGSGGGGCYPNPTVPALSVGGDANKGGAIIAYYT